MLVHVKCGKWYVYRIFYVLHVNYTDHVHPFKISGEDTSSHFPGLNILEDNFRFGRFRTCATRKTKTQALRACLYFANIS